MNSSSSPVPDDFQEESPLVSRDVESLPSSSSASASLPSDDVSRPVGATKELDPKKKLRFYIVFGVVFAMLAGGMIAGVVLLSRGSPVDGLTADSIRSLLASLEEKGRGPTGSRDPASGGYNLSAAFLESELRSSVSCDVRRQYFQSVQYRLNSPASLSMDGVALVSGTDFVAMRYSGAGVSPAQGLKAVFWSSACALNFSGFPQGRVAAVDLAQAPSSACSFIDMGLAAQDAGAAAVLFVNGPSATLPSGARVRKPGYLAGDRLMQIPVFSLGRAVGLLMNQTNATLTFSVNSTIEILTTFNVLCETRTGDANSLVVIGAHLDGVPGDGRWGANDNGSGSMSVLEIAKQWSGAFDGLKSRVLFAWWGSEEEGLIGSRYFATNATDMNRIAVYINCDMLGSPNGVRGINGPSSFNANGSAVVFNAIAASFNETNLPYETHAMVGGSDFQPFAEYGIATSGVATGAGGIKSEEQRRIFGGYANAPFDPCYHASCDSPANVKVTLTAEMAKAVFTAALKLATMDNLRLQLR